MHSFRSNNLVTKPEAEHLKESSTVVVQFSAPRKSKGLNAPNTPSICMHTVHLLANVPPSQSSLPSFRHYAPSKSTIYDHLAWGFNSNSEYPNVKFRTFINGEIGGLLIFLLFNLILQSRILKPSTSEPIITGKSLVPRVCMQFSKNVVPKHILMLSYWC